MSPRKRRMLLGLFVVGVFFIYRPYLCSPHQLEPVPSDNPRGISQVAWGERLFTDFACTGCHSITGVRGVGGALDGIVGQTRRFTGGGELIVDDDYIRESITSPRLKIVAGFSPSMPRYDMTDAQLDALVAYISQLR